MADLTPSQRMRNFGVVQHSADILSQPARAFDLPGQRDEAERVTDELLAAMERIGQAHALRPPHPPRPDCVPYRVTAADPSPQ
ncbi:hypothetical protein [Streptomyces sp. NPDC000880]